VIQFLAAEKDTVGNIHKWLANVYGNAAVYRSHWAKGVMDEELGKVHLLYVLHQPET
jgi:hypothetical protein